MIVIAKSSKAFRIAFTTLVAASLATCAVTASTSGSSTPTSVQVADGGTPTPTLDGFHW